jgi:2,3-diketo-5-methylthio-1-phosphopentane phosphatase
MTALDTLIICDFDGTIAHDDVTDLLLQRFAAPQWELIERRWQVGQLTSRECLLQQTELLRLTRAQLAAMLPAVRLDPGFAEFVTAAHAAGCEVQIASEGFDQVIRALLARLDLPPLPIAATYLIKRDADTWTLGFPFAREGCRTGAATCKCALAESARRDERRVVLIGDGLSDRCIAQQADFVFARGRLLDFCREQHLPHQAAPDFATVMRYLGPRLAAMALRGATAHG